MDLDISDEDICNNSRDGIIRSSRRRRRPAWVSWKIWCFLLGFVLVVSVSHFMKKTRAAQNGLNATTKQTSPANDEAFQVPPVDDGMHPQVAWIMSFGGSGTSYTLMNTEHVTGFSTATNYGHESNSCVPVHTNWTNGPYRHSTQLQLPQEYILTKTHCGGFCMDCAPSGYAYHGESAIDDFERDCLTGNRPGDNTTIYTSDIVQRAVHLIRDPFDNLVGRMHLSSKLAVKRGTENPKVRTDLYEWCSYLDNKYADSEARSDRIDQTLLKAFPNLPCRAEWYRYVQWHNLAMEVIDRLNLPVYHLFYENYTSHFDDTVDQLLDFLHMYKTGGPKEFLAGKTYRSMFRTEHVQMAAGFTREFALPRVWELLRHYFDDVMLPGNGDDDDTNVDPDFHFDTEDVVSFNNTAPDTDDDSFVVEADEEIEVPVAEAATNINAEVAWLLSFPNSGTSYTITNTEHLSNMSTASNYVADWETLVSVRPELTQGPFLHNPSLGTPNLVLTKTHCTGYCTDCGPKKYIIKSVDEFQEGCRRVDATVNGRATNFYYDESVPVKAVHLIRDPFDNLVARLHLHIRQLTDTNELAKFTDDRQGLLNWCSYLDKTFIDEEKSYNLIRPKVLSLFHDVPCHGEWFRYVQWHNLALKMTEMMELPVFYLHYERYEQHYDKAVSDLFGFLDLTPVKEPLKFLPGKHYTDYYSDNERRAAARLVKELASPDCWELISSYFEGLLE